MSCLFIPSTIIILVADCGITMLVMKKQIDLEVTMDRDLYQNQLADGRKPDDESINSVVALMSNRDSQLCSSGKNKLSSFFRTFFMDNLVYLGFENDSGPSYSKKTKNARDWCNDSFSHNKAFVPIHIVNSRFILAVILIQDRGIVFYDMLQSDVTANRYRTILLCYLKKEYSKKYGKTLHNDWSVHARQPELSPSYTNDDTYNFRY